MKDPLSVGDGARASLIERLREKVIMGGGYADIAGDDLESLIQQLEHTQALYDELMAGYDRLRADTDAAIRLRVPAAVTDEMVTAAMRAFERMSSVLRYREANKWHSCDIMGMRDAIAAALLQAALLQASSEHAPSSAPPDAGSRG